VNNPEAPLDGITVVSLEQAVAGPLASRQLGDLGARVIKVERADGGDFARGYDRAVAGTSAHFTWLNRGKESLAIDLRNPAGRDAVQRLIARADVFLQNLAPGAAERLGLGSEALRDRYPELIVINLSGYGVGGPMEQHKAFDMLVQAESGLVAITGTPETPVKSGIPTADIASGMYCAQGAIAALLRRARATRCIRRCTRGSNCRAWVSAIRRSCRTTRFQPKTVRCSSGCRTTTAGAVS
jgi:itaconate CoA-transferase